MDVPASRGVHPGEEAAVFGALAGCLALAARPHIFLPALAVTIAVGVAGALAPAPYEAGPAAVRRFATWIAATGLGVAAFASIRLAAAVPPGPATLRTGSVAVIAAVAEELFFRRFLYGALLRRGVALAVCGSALAFALVHIPAYGMGVFPIDLAAGLVLSWQRWASGSWTASAASHAAANLMAIL